MDTRYYKLTGEDGEVLEEAAKVIREGGLVAFPTETVYGLGGDAFRAESSSKIYAAKGRPSDNPLIVHISKEEDLSRVSDEVPQAAYTLAKRFWPGPLTMIFKKKKEVPDETTGGLDTVAVRMPDHRAALKLIELSGTLIAAPSANLSGRPSPTTGEHVLEDMDGRIDVILDGGKSLIGLESTIVDLTGERACLLRPGFIGVSLLKEVLGELDIDPAVLGELKEGEKPRAPGMKYRHYAPRGEVVIVSGEKDAVIGYINDAAEKHIREGHSVGVIATAKFRDSYTCPVKCIGDTADEEEIAANLFAVLREFDEEGTEFIYSEELNTPRLGMAVMNRLIKAAGHRIIDVDR